MYLRKGQIDAALRFAPKRDAENEPAALMLAKNAIRAGDASRSIEIEHSDPRLGGLLRRADAEILSKIAGQAESGLVGYGTAEQGLLSWEAGGRDGTFALEREPDALPFGEVEPPEHAQWFDVDGETLQAIGRAALDLARDTGNKSDRVVRLTLQKNTLHAQLAGARVIAYAHENDET